MIKGFEDDVGTKTSFYGFTVNTMKNSLISYRELGFTSVPQGQVRPLLGATVPRAPPRGRHRVPRAQPSGTEQPWTGAGVAGRCPLQAYGVPGDSRGPCFPGEEAEARCPSSSKAVGGLGFKSRLPP